MHLEALLISTSSLSLPGVLSFLVRCLLSLFFLPLRLGFLDHLAVFLVNLFVDSLGAFLSNDPLPLLDYGLALWFTDE